VFPRHCPKARIHKAPEDVYGEQDGKIGADSSWPELLICRPEIAAQRQKRRVQDIQAAENQVISPTGMKDDSSRIFNAAAGATLSRA